MAWTSADLAAHYRSQGKEPPAGHEDAQALQKRADKYGRKKKEIDGITFDSTLEANVYLILKTWCMAGAIRDLRMQPTFTLQERFKDSAGRTVRMIAYSADFRFFDIDQGRIRYVDAKGRITQAFSKSLKQMKDKYPDVEIELWDSQKVKELSRQ